MFNIKILKNYLYLVYYKVNIIMKIQTITIVVIILTMKNHPYDEQFQGKLSPY